MTECEQLLDAALEREKAERHINELLGDALNRIHRHIFGDVPVNMTPDEVADKVIGFVSGVVIGSL